MDKIYFFDLGVRNLLIDNLNLLKNRSDIGQLWENFLITERMKRLHYSQAPFSLFYWRLTSGAELDLIESTQGVLHGYEFKYSPKTKSPPLSWQQTYPDSTFQVINQTNWLDFVAPRPK
jgi:hypothetical protein